MASYTCSAHPEIQRDRADNCPKCGNKLVQQESGDIAASDENEPPKRRKSLLWRWQ